MSRFVFFVFSFFALFIDPLTDKVQPLSRLEGLLLHVDCDELRVRSGLDEDEQKEDGFLYSFTLDRPW